MYCVRKVTEDLTWVGGNDRRLALFEGVYDVPKGVSYNSYLLMDEKTVLFDTVDHSVDRVFFENIDHVLAGRKLDALVVQHMEPDHAATIQEVVRRYPGVRILCNQKTANMMAQYFTFDVSATVQIVKEGDVFETGHHSYTFVMAPMVHWPEVMVTYDLTEKILFSADAFGTFGAIDGALFADEVDFFRDYLDEARRYYCNIVGKYGTQVTALLTKAAGLEIKMVCPLHGFVWRKDIGEFIEKYLRWATYTPEETGVVIAYASVYGNTANAAEILSCRLRELGIKTCMFDVSMTPASYVVAAAFRYSHLVFAATTYNAGIFVNMENLLHDIAAHNLQNRTVAFVENGSWAPTSGKLMRQILSPLKNMTMLDQSVTIRSSLKETEQLEILVQAIADTMPKAAPAAEAGNAVDPNAMFKLSYGLFVLAAREGEKDNGCIVNTVIQLTDTPKRVAFAGQVSKAKIITKITRDSFEDIVENMDVGSVFYPRYIAAEAVVRYVRAMANSTGSNVETLYSIVGDKAEALEFRVSQGSRVCGIPLQDLRTRPGILIGSIHRGARVFIPRGQDTIEEGDSVVVVTTLPNLNDLDDILERRR